MKYTALFTSFLLLFSFIFSCQKEEDRKIFTVKNTLDMDRQAETISLSVEQISVLADKFGVENLLIREEGSEEVLVRQLVDVDQDGEVDEILFQTDLPANAEKTFLIEGQENGAELQGNSELTTYSRFVEERNGDYAWENDRVGFRTYGPETQRLAESGAQGGGITSGIDAWLKRVNYPIINKWYAENMEEPGAYHVDTGEGYDPYPVGGSRGIGGIGVWANDSLYVSKNFVDYKTIATGPIRTIFELTYAPWEADGRSIQETKRISLDLGSNLSRFEVKLDSEAELPAVAIGLSLHDQQGEVKVKEDEGWFRYWEPMDGSWLGVGLVMDPAIVEGHVEQQVEAQNQSNLLALADQGNKPLVYYAGFGWKKSGQFNSAEEWDQYLENFAKRKASPVEVIFE